MSKKSRRRRENEKIYRQIIDKLEQSYKSSRYGNALRATFIIVLGLYGCIIMAGVLSGSSIDFTKFCQNTSNIRRLDCKYGGRSQQFSWKMFVRLLSSRTYFLCQHSGTFYGKHHVYTVHIFAEYRTKLSIQRVYQTGYGGYIYSMVITSNLHSFDLHIGDSTVIHP